MPRDLKASTTVGLDSSVPDELSHYAKANVCQVSITHPLPAVSVSVIGTGDEDLNPADGGFTDILNSYESAFNSGTAFTVLADGRVQANEDGVVIITGYSDISHSNNGTTVGAAFSIERLGSQSLSPRSVHSRMPNAGNIGNLSGTGTLPVLSGDIIGLALASDVTGDISIRASSLVFNFAGV